MAFYQEPNLILYRGHALSVLRELPDESVDCCMTSPPYWGLRTYKTEPIVWCNGHCEHEWGNLIPHPMHKSGDHSINSTLDDDTGKQQDIVRHEGNQGNFCLKCHAWKGELGLEPTIELYISHLIQIFDEVKRVLKRTGTCWVNIVDSYSGSGQGKNGDGTIGKLSEKQRTNKGTVEDEFRHGIGGVVGIPAKSLCLIPERFALAMVTQNWICRNDIIWYKANPMPESVKDRFTGTYEHVYFFVKSKKYWFEQQFEPSIIPYDINHVNIKRDWSDQKTGNPIQNTNPQALPQGRNKRDVWEINTQPYPEAHFATYPEKLCEIPILSGCPSMICTKCGKAREKIYETEGLPRNRKDCKQYNIGNQSGMSNLSGPKLEAWREEHPLIDKGYSNCGCGAKFEPGTVLDPFTGSGTTLAVAKRLNRKSIGIELNLDYCRLAVDRISKIALPMELKI
jgi:DNA modification methylase